MQEIAAIPRPTSLVVGSSSFTLDAGTTLSCAPGAEPVARLVRSLVGPATGYALAAGGEESGVRLDLDARLAHLGDEGYRLAVGREGVRLSASADAGLRNGTQTLLQLMDPAVHRRAVIWREAWSIPHVEIEDSPRFAWRGAHLDVSRHFMPAHFLLRFVDLLAMHKLNVLHLHLTDDQGWRLPSAKYPRLTEVGAWRTESMVGHRSEETYDGTPHGGFYSREQLTELVAYAAERNITVVPEIDLPGHVQAAIAAYPELGNSGEQLAVWTRWGVSEHVLNVEDATLAFCRDVLGELLEIFPSRYVHVGGDECPKSEWHASAAAQRRIASLGLRDEDALQSWFTGELDAYLRAAGRSLVGWDEILEGGPLPKGATVLSWRGTRGGIAAASAGFDVVMCPERPCYFDHYQSDDELEPLAIGGRNTLEDVYRYEPVPEELDAAAAAHVLGSQFQLWTEYLSGPSEVEYMAFPRGAAHAEVAWSQPGGDYAEFTARLARHLARLDALDVNYRPLAGPHPWQAGGTGARKRRAGS